MNNYDLGRRQIHARICGSDLWIVPVLDVAEENSRDRFGSEPEFGCDAGQVVSNHVSAEHGWDVKDLALRGFEIVILHRGVRSSKVNCALGYLLDAAAGTDRLIVELQVRVRLVVSAEPFLVDRIWKRSARALQPDFRACRARTCIQDERTN